MRLIILTKVKIQFLGTYYQGFIRNALIRNPMVWNSSLLSTCDQVFPLNIFSIHPTLRAAPFVSPQPLHAAHCFASQSPTGFLQDSISPLLHYHHPALTLSPCGFVKMYLIIIFSVCNSITNFSKRRNKRKQTWRLSYNFPK